MTNTADESVTEKDVTKVGLPNGYFDERRAQVRLQILSFYTDLERAKEIEAWVFGEE